MKTKSQNGSQNPPKEEILKNIKSGLEEVKQHKAGVINLKEAREFLDEFK
jgi:hypothetical protein